MGRDGAEGMAWPQIGLALGTFGSEDWRKRGEDTLKRVRCTQTREFAAYSHVHGTDLADARNRAAEECGDVDNLVFLDADDYLEPHYCEYMAKKENSLSYRSDRQHWLIQPSTRGVYPDGTEDELSVVIPYRDLSKSNFMVIGTMCSRRFFFEAGGFRDLDALEDWDLWMRMVLCGAGIATNGDAVYMVGVHEQSRNMTTRKHNLVYNRLRAEYKVHAQKLREAKVIG